MKFEPIQTLSGTTIGYALPPEIENLSNSFVKMQTLSLDNIGFLLPPNPELLKIKELIQTQSLNNTLLGFMLPPEVEKLNKIVSQFKTIFDLPQLTPPRVNFDWIYHLQPLIDNLEIEPANKQQATESISHVTDELAKNGRLSLSDIVALISLFFSLIALYPTVKEIYKDVTYNPIVEMCGVLTELEKEMVKFVKVEHRAGIPLYQYPNGKKEVAFLMNGTQICMLSEPKGNVKRVKVVYQMENHKQTYGYVDRNKLKRLYKID